MSGLTSVTIEPLQAVHIVADFNCGKPTLDAWVRSRAFRNQETGDSRTFVVVETGHVVAFYTMTTASAPRVGLPGRLRRNTPDPVPLLLLAQLAVHTTHRGTGLGRRLLFDALTRAEAVLQHAGFRAVATHPLDDAAEAFYVRFGFSAVPDSEPRLMVMPTQRLLAHLAAAR